MVTFQLASNFSSRVKTDFFACVNRGTQFLWIYCVHFFFLAQYLLQVENAQLRWFHRNENGSTVFSIITDGPVLSNGKWYHIAAMYDGLRGNSRIYINGRLSKQETADPGIFLSRDWSKYVGTCNQLLASLVPVVEKVDFPLRWISHYCVRQNAYYLLRFVTTVSFTCFVIPLRFLLVAAIMISRPEETNRFVLFANVLSTKWYVL